MTGAFTDGAAAAERILTKLKHDPSGIALTLGAPVIMVLLFGYIFGGAIAVPGGDYRAFLVPGLFATIGTNIVPSMFAMARDSNRGVVDRFRSLPISRTAVPFGQASILTFPVMMLSNVYVPTSGMPAWLRAIADWNPVSALAAALRDLFGSPTAPTNGTWQLEHPVIATLAWTVLLLAVFVPLCTRRFARGER